MGRASISLHFGRGEPPSGVPLDYVAEDDAWMIGTVLDEAELRSPTEFPGGPVLDFVSTEWRDHVRYNAIAFVHVMRALERANSSFQAAWARYSGSDAPRENADSEPRLGLHLRVRLKVGRGRGQGGRGRREGISVRLRFGPRGDLAKVSRNFFVSSAGCSIRTFDTPAERARMEQGAGKTWTPVPIHNDDGDPKWASFRPDPDFWYVSEPVSVKIDLKNMPVFEASIKNVERVLPPSTLSSDRLEYKELYLTNTEDTKWFRFGVDVFVFINSALIRQYVHENRRLFYGPSRITGERMYLGGNYNGPFQHDFRNSSDFEYPFSGVLRIHFGKTKILDPFYYYLSESGATSRDMISDIDFSSEGVMPMGQVSVVDIGAGAVWPPSDEPDWVMRFVPAKECVKLISGLLVETIQAGPGVQKLYRITQPKFELRNPSGLPIVLNCPDFSAVWIVGGVRKQFGWRKTLSPGEVVLVGGEVTEPCELYSSSIYAYFSIFSTQDGAPLYGTVTLPA